MPVIHFYYSSLPFIPLMAMMLYAAHMLTEGFHMPLWVPWSSKIAVSILLAGYFIADQHASSIFTQRDLRNKIAMENAMQDKTDYVPYDDPVISMNLMTDISPNHSGHTARVAYKYWLERTPILLEKQSY